MAAPAVRGEILIVDDEPSLLNLMSAYLTRFGFKVASCPTAEEAWQMVERTPARYLVVVVDMTLPGMGGEELARKILSAGPETRVLACSGFPFDVRTLGAEARTRFLMKPFSPEALMDSVEKLMRPAANSGQAP